jgi:hypothetical protein
MATDGYKPGALSWLTRPLEVGSATFPRLLSAPVGAGEAPPDLDTEPLEEAAWLGWPTAGAWCE